MTAFREGRKDVLVATDVASKGLDFPNIVHVINYDMPEDIENYGMKILDLSGHLIKDKSNNLRSNCLLVLQISSAHMYVKPIIVSSYNLKWLTFI